MTSVDRHYSFEDLPEYIDLQTPWTNPYSSKIRLTGSYTQTDLEFIFDSIKRQLPKYMSNQHVFGNWPKCRAFKNTGILADITVNKKAEEDQSWWMQKKDGYFGMKLIPIDVNVNKPGYTTYRAKYYITLNKDYRNKKYYVKSYEEISTLYLTE